MTDRERFHRLCDQLRTRQITYPEWVRQTSAILPESTRLAASIYVDMRASTST